MEVSGIIKLINDTESFGSNGFTKRGVVITTPDQYPQDLLIEFIKDKCSLLDNYAEGQEVTISINLRGNEYNGKYYVSLQGWKIEGIPLPASAVAKPTAKAPTPPPIDEEEEDLPF